MRLISFFLFINQPTTHIYTLSYTTLFRSRFTLGPSVKLTETRLEPGTFIDSLAPYGVGRLRVDERAGRSEEHTSELQSLRHLVCRLPLEKKKQRLSFWT